MEGRAAPLTSTVRGAALAELGVLAQFHHRRAQLGRGRAVHVHRGHVDRHHGDATSIARKVLSAKRTDERSDEARAGWVRVWCGAAAATLGLRGGGRGGLGVASRCAHCRVAPCGGVRSSGTTPPRRYHDKRPMSPEGFCRLRRTQVSGSVGFVVSVVRCHIARAWCVQSCGSFVGQSARHRSAGRPPVSSMV